MIKIDVQYPDKLIEGKVYRLYPRGTRRPRSKDIRIVHPCRSYEPIVNNGDEKPTMLEHHCKYYSDPI